MHEHHPVVDLLKKMISFPSLSTQEGPIADFMFEFAQQSGIVAHRLNNNVWFELGSGKKTLLLNSHLDVVPASEQHPFEPFTAVEKDGMLYGRGSVDAKASGAAMLMALIALKEEGWQPAKGKLIVALTACEEGGGGYNGLQELRPHLPFVDAALVGEPTEMQPCIAQKGLLILKALNRGITAHAARAHLGKNAILEAAKDIQRVADYHFEKDDPFLGAPSANVTLVQGGTVHNQIPERCEFTIDIRTTPAYTHPEITALFRELLHAEVRVHSDRIVSVKTSPDAAIVKACRTALPDAQPFGSPTASDWIYLQGIPTVKIGPGKSERSHTADEHISISALTISVNSYIKIIKAYFYI